MMLTPCSIKKCAAQSLYCPNVTSLTRRMKTTAVCFMLCWKLHSTKDLTASSPAVRVGFERRIGYGSSHHNTYSPLSHSRHTRIKTESHTNKHTRMHAHTSLYILKLPCGSYNFDTLFSEQY